jgi:hypothetical protein
MLSNGGVMIDKEKRKKLGENYPSAALSSMNHIWRHVVPNPRFSSGMGPDVCAFLFKNNIIYSVEFK